MRILILGGTTEARQLAVRLLPFGAVTLSLAGRTQAPAAQGVPVRVGGFGGAEGLARHLRDERIDLLVDATHPFAARISANAAEAAAGAGVAAIALSRPAWQQVERDRWTVVDDLAGAVAALGSAPRRVLLAIGRQEVAAFAAAPHHAYLIRSIDPVDPPLAVPRAEYLLARGPFTVAAEIDLMRRHRIDAVVAKNAGGEATYAKIAAARELGIEVVMVQRPPMPPGIVEVATVDEAVAHVAASAKRGE